MTRFRSYAQNFEDLRLARAFAGQASGFYIDVGAAHPRVDSVTRHFYDLGWRGVDVEPDAEPAALLRAERPRDVVLEAACSDHDGEVELHAVSPAVGWSTLSAEVAAEVVAKLGGTASVRRVPAVTLGHICDEYAPDGVDFLKVDAEAHEREVLAGLPLDRHRPRVLVVEAVWPHSPAPSHQAWEPRLLEGGYLLAHFDGLNRFYVRAEEPELVEPLARPVTPFDLWELDRYVLLVEERDGRLAEQAARIEDLEATLRDAETRAARSHAQAEAFRERWQQEQGARGVAEDHAQQWWTRWEQRHHTSLRVPAGVVRRVRGVARRLRSL